MQITVSKSTPAVPATATARRLIRASVSPNTWRAYKTALRQVDGFAGKRKLTDALFAEYLGKRFDDGVSPATMRMHMAAVAFRHAHIGDGGKSPIGPLSKRVMVGAAREGASRGRGQVDGLSWAAVDAAAAVAVKDGSLAGIRDAAVLLVQSDAMLRVSEVAALDTTDLENAGDGKGGTVTIRHSKTDAQGRGAVLFIRKRTLDAVALWKAESGITDGALFRSVSRHGKLGKRISDRSVRRIVSKRAADAGAHGRISGHSARVGGAENLCAAGASLPAMMQAGRWRSVAMPAHYSRKVAAASSAVAVFRPA